MHIDTTTGLLHEYTVYLCVYTPGGCENERHIVMVHMYHGIAEFRQVPDFAACCSEGRSEQHFFGSTC